LKNILIKSDSLTEYTCISQIYADRRIAQDVNNIKTRILKKVQLIKKINSHIE
jgi:hypothetical protein